jgi:hypothetical protein
VSQSGKFNYDLHRTGFLGETKMRAKRIAQNPKRFLEAYADGRGDNAEIKEFVPTELPELEHFIQNLVIDTRFHEKAAVMKKRTESAKFQTFLFSMSSMGSSVNPKTFAFLNRVPTRGDIAGGLEKKSSAYEG